MIRKVNFFWFLSIVTSVVFLHFSPIKPLGYPLTIVPFLMFYFLIKVIDFDRFRYKVSVVSVLILFSFFIVFKDFFVVFYSDFSVFLYFKTYFLWFFYFVFFTLFLLPFKINALQYKRETVQALDFSIVIILLCVTFQYLYYNLTGDLNIYALWGEASYSNQDYVLESISFGALKSTGFYLEPSALALVCFSLLTARFLFEFDFKILVFVLITVFLSGSAAGVLSVVILTTIVVFKSDSLLISLNVKYFVVVSIVFFVSTLAPYLLLRFDTVLLEGSSAYYRLVAPLIVLKDILIDSPLGVSFGMLESTLFKYHLLNGEEEGGTLDNGWYLIVFYFGWVGVFFNMFFLMFLIKKVFLGNIFQSISAVYFLLSPLYTGAIFSPEFLFLQLLVIIAYRLSYVKN